MRVAAGRFRKLTALRAVVAALFAAVVVFCMDGDASAQTSEFRPSRPLIFVPGLMGSRLCRDNPADPAQPQVVWGTVSALREFPDIRLAPPGTPDGIKPCGLLREIVMLGSFKQHYYGPAISHLESIGYREGRDLFVFDYDWRRSAFDNAQALDGFVRANVGESRVDILAHSMGGLVARIYTVRYGKDRVARLISAGAPFQGAAKVFQTVEKGWGALNVAMGGLSGFRRTMLSFPSIFELMARYESCCGDGATAFRPSRESSWTALGWEGVDPALMPDLGATFARVEDLKRILAGPLPAGVEDVLLIGVDQRTAQRVQFEKAGRGARIRVQTSWAGDGTVLRDSAVLPRTALHPTSFAIHERILMDPQIRDFLKVALSRSVAAAIDSVPVRPRGAVAGVSGEVTELVGVVVETAEPAYQTGDKGLARVHVRLGTTAPLSPQVIRLSHTTPDGQQAIVPLAADPSASEPGNAFEQSFAGVFETGTAAGMGQLRAVVTLEGASPRIVEEPVLILRR
jgi:pimeloyl-ACP methyl ester carboxylesterase